MDDWKVSNKKNDKIVKKEILEIELPKIKGKFDLSIFSNSVVKVIKNKDQENK